VVADGVSQEVLLKALENVGTKGDEKALTKNLAGDRVVMQDDIRKIAPDLKAYMQKMLVGMDLKDMDIRLNEDAYPIDLSYKNKTFLISPAYYEKHIKPLVQAFDARIVQPQAYQQARFKVAAEGAWSLFSRQLMPGADSKSMKLDFYVSGAFKIMDKAETPDSSELTDNASAEDAALTPGGIDLNPAGMALDVKGDASVQAIPPDVSGLEQFRGVSGLSPVILDISPVDDLPAFLGIAAH
jgi:hypothetical protein